MNDKGYQHPLLSLNLLGPRQEFPDESIYSIPVPEGLLVVSKALRKRAQAFTMAATEGAVGRALAQHGLWTEGLSKYGLDEVWVRSMRHWSRHLSNLEQDWMLLSDRLETAQKHRRGLRQSGATLWRQLALTARLAHVTSPVPARMPRGELGLLTGLQYAMERLEEPAYALLDSRGFDEKDRAMLRRVVDGLRGLPAKELKFMEQRRRVSAMILVVRGALIGDVIHMGKVAQMAIGPLNGRKLMVGKLLGI